MKNLILFLALVAPVMGWGQTVDGVDLATHTGIDYVEIVGFNQGLFKKKIVVIVDYGQKITAFESDTRVQGPEGKPIIFNSMMDAVNRFSGWGWQLMFAYDVNAGQAGTVYHYVLRRKDSKE